MGVHVQRRPRHQTAQARPLGRPQARHRALHARQAAFPFPEDMQPELNAFFEGKVVEHGLGLRRVDGGREGDQYHVQDPQCTDVLPLNPKFIKFSYLLPPTT